MADDAQYVSRYSTKTVGIITHVAGQIGDVDGNTVTVTMRNASSGVVMTRTATREEAGVYSTILSSAETQEPGRYTVSWDFTVNGLPQTVVRLLDVGEAAPDYDALDEHAQGIVEQVWDKFEDAFDSPLGGPNLQTYFQTKFSRNRLAKLLRTAVGKLNTIAQPYANYSLDPGGKVFPYAQWGPLLEQALYCVEPSTPVLRDDLLWVPAGEIRTGDRVVAFDEEIVGGKFRTAMVLDAREQVSPRLRVTTSIGDILVTPEHRFVVRRHQGTSSDGKPVFRRSWCEARHLRPGVDEVISVGEPWHPSSSYEAGWLAGMLDGEGCLTFTDQSRGTSTAMSRIFLSQKPGPVLDRAKESAKALGFEMAESIGTHANVLHVRGGFTEQLRFLGTLRPTRLLGHPRFHDLWEGRGMRQISLPSAHVLAVEPSLDGPVSVIQTSTGTLLTAGLLSHNCEVIKHLIRSYTEQPVAELAAGVSRLDRRDYTQRWAAVLDMEQNDFRSQMDVFKISQMGLGRARVLVSGGVFGNYFPTRVAGMAARPRFWGVFY